MICGGGSGHEPGTVGFVGKGLLNASVAGDVFASPSARQVFGAIERVGSEKGVILIITNCESYRAQWDGLPVLHREDGEKVVKECSIARSENGVVNSRFDGCM